jgi:sulfite reductase (NADPH) flavoprotein alpha-component
VSSVVPVIPESAPFSAEQRAYLNGFLAGLLSRAPVDELASAPAPAGRQPLSIVYGSQTGNAESLAKRAANEARKHGFAPTVHDLGSYSAAQLAAERHLLVITSTYGDGEPPDNAKPFWEVIRNGTAPSVKELRYAVLALGDSSYPKFCEFGKSVDERLAAMGGQRAHPRLDCDVDFDSAFAGWIGGALSGLADAASGDKTVETVPRFGRVADTRLKPGVTTDSGFVNAPDTRLTPGATGYGRANPFPAPLLTNRPLNATGSAKDTRHLEFSLEGSGLEYQAGDALAVRPCNCPNLVSELAEMLGFKGDEDVYEKLLRDYEITRVPVPLVKAVADKTGDITLQKLGGPELTKFLHGRDVLDFVRDHPAAKFSPDGFLPLLKKLPPRLYSIASSPKAHPGQVHLCVAVVRTEFGGRPRQGVCSTFLADRCAIHSTVPVYVHHNKNFRPPSDPATPMIMVGPGTGIAPFRAFLEERRAVSAKGKNWLFFGDQHAATDFLYADEIDAMLRDQTLARLHTAFSRDQAEKIYVQQRMLENARELFAWLEQGAHFYVCGDAKRMANDVDRALHQIIEIAGGRTADQATEYVRALSAAKRYQRDVY